MIDGGIPENWPEAVLHAMAEFSQGSLLERPPLLYSRSTSDPVWLGDTNQIIEANSGVESVEMPSPDYGIVTTQTCDVRDQSREQPWIQVSPVYRLPAEHKAKSFLYPITSVHLPEGTWAADLRLEVPIEKSVLAHRLPIAGFATEQDEIEFALALGRQRDRAALHDHVNTILYSAWNRKINNNGSRARRLLPAVYAVRLAIASGSRLEPEAVQVHFVSRAGLDGFTAETLEWLAEWWDAARQVAADASPALNLLANRYHDGGAVDVSIYDELIPLDWLRHSWMQPSSS
jgi:hypothetical protein